MTRGVIQELTLPCRIRVARYNGSVANSEKIGTLLGADRTIGSPWPLSSQTVELIYEAALRNRAHLSLANHLDDFNALEGGMCAVEGFETKCGSRFLFDGPVGLFDDIVEVFALPNFDVCARFIVVSLNR